MLWVCFFEIALFTLRSLFEPLFRQYFSNVIDVEAVAHAGIFLRRLHDGDVAVAIVVAWSRAVQDAEGFDFAFAIESDDLIAILCFSSVSVVHFFVGCVGY
jgi:hypothetical protein